MATLSLQNYFGILLLFILLPQNWSLPLAEESSISLMPEVPADTKTASPTTELVQASTQRRITRHIGGIGGLGVGGFVGGIGTGAIATPVYTVPIVQTVPVVTTVPVISTVSTFQTVPSYAYTPGFGYGTGGLIGGGAYGGFGKFSQSYHAKSFGVGGFGGFLG